jgi:hypothetical protein
MKGMGRALVLAVLVLVAPIAMSGQTLAVLHIRAVMTDAAGQATPVARHALLISDNPPTREPRRVVTTIDGTADVRLPPGTYTVESDEPLAFQGKAYRWLRTVVVAVGRDATLELTAANAEIEAIEASLASAGAGAAAPLATDPTMAVRPFLESVLQIWTPTAHASGFLVDAAGLIATSEKVVRGTTTVEVQVSRTVKVAGTVLEADRQRDIALIRVDPSVTAALTPLPLKCPATGASTVARGQEIIAIAAPLRQNRGINWGAVTRFDARVITTELNLAAGGLGGPAFNTAGELVGITTLHGEREEPLRGIVKVARIDPACDVMAAAVKKMSGTPAPSAALLPMEPATPAPVAAFKEAVRKRAGNLKPYSMVTTDFDVGFITPILAYAAQSQAAQDFGAWSDYVADIPPVLFVRVTPKMVESMWAKMARGAAMTQGMALPAIKRLGTGFNRMRVLCGSSEVTPVHPFKLELRVSDTEAIEEGLYAFDPAALGPGCGTVSLELYSEKAPDKPDTRAVPPATLQQIWRDVGLQ